MKLIEFLKAREITSSSAGQAIIGKVIMTVLLLGLSMTQVADVYAACGATINGRAMTMEECLLAKQIYGHVEPGDYLRDGSGSWVNIRDPYSRGNVYQDALQPSGSGGSSSNRNPSEPYWFKHQPSDWFKYRYRYRE